MEISVERFNFILLWKKEVGSQGVALTCDDKVLEGVGKWLSSVKLDR